MKNGLIHDNRRSSSGFPEVNSCDNCENAKYMDAEVHGDFWCSIAELFRYSFLPCGGIITVQRYLGEREIIR